jgi:glycoside/pentoside/hexuronide:cation symporter, GPH family
MTDKPTLPLNKQIAYAVGQLGWSTLVNIIGLTLVYFYLPPTIAGLPTLITTVVFLGMLNAVTLIAASGRLLDAVTDPLIASFSDRSTHPRGRRIPLMRWGALPAAIFCVLMFVPPVQAVSVWNIVWLLVMQAFFYLFLTIYVTPFFALLPELGHTANQRLNLSTWISITYALGIILAAQMPLLADLLQSGLGLADRMLAVQYAIGLLAGIAVILMYVPIFTIDERVYCESVPSQTPMLPALRHTFTNIHFRFYVVADFAYFTSLTIIQTGLLFYVTVLLFQGEALVSTLLTVMVLVSFVFYPVVNLLARRTGKKILIVLTFFTMSAVFLGVFFLGRLPLPELVQGYGVVLLFAVPMAFAGVLPNAVLADIAEHDGLRSGVKQEGMFFAARTFMQKIGQTTGILIFAALATLGRDPGMDLGIRLSGVAGFLLCFSAALIFSRYNERKVLRELKEMGSA